MLLRGRIILAGLATAIAAGTLVVTIGPASGTDTTAPTVSVTAPAANSTVSGTTTTVSATASDNVGVSGVQFKLDGANLGAEDTASPYSITWDTTTASNGSHTITAVARDAAGNTTTSSGVTVTVSNGATFGVSVANFWVDTTGGTCTRQATPGAYVDADACASPGTAYASASSGDVIGVKGGTYSSNWDFAYRAAFANTTCDPKGSWGSVVTSTCVKVAPAVSENVTLNGHIQVNSGAVWINGSVTNGVTNPNNYEGRAFNITVNGYVDTEADSTTNFPDHVTFEGIDAKQIGAYSSKNVAFYNMDAGPFVMGTGCAINGSFGGSLAGNNTAYGGGITVTPTDILFQRVLFHGANRDANGKASDCHTGGFFLKGGTGIVFRYNVWLHNAVYNVQIQSVGGAPIGSLTFENNWFGCPVDWQNGGGNGVTSDANCLGQSDIQFNASNLFSDIKICFNSFQNGVSAFDAATFSNARMCGNTGSVPSSGVCADPGWTGDYNVWVGGTCWANDGTVAAMADLFTGLVTNDQDLHLLNTTNAANNKVSPSTGDYAVTTDIDGQTRPVGANRDAGSDEQ